MADALLRGWKRIAVEIDRSVGAARRYAARSDDPLPVLEQLGRVVARPDQVSAWLARQDRAWRD